MILGMSVATFTLVHVLISLLGMAAGGVVLVAMIHGEHREGWTAVFIAGTVVTSVTGFMFHATHIGAQQLLGAASLIALTSAVLALYGHHLRGGWRSIYVASAVAALYFDVFVGVVQAFQEVAPLKSLAPTLSEPPFVIAQLLVLMLFLVLGGVALKTFRPNTTVRTVRTV